MTQHVETHNVVSVTFSLDNPKTMCLVHSLVNLPHAVEFLEGEWENMIFLLKNHIEEYTDPVSGRYKCVPGTLSMLVNLMIPLRVTPEGNFLFVTAVDIHVDSPRIDVTSVPLDVEKLNADVKTLNTLSVEIHHYGEELSFTTFIPDQVRKQVKKKTPDAYRSALTSDPDGIQQMRWEAFDAISKELYGHLFTLSRLGVISGILDDNVAKLCAGENHTVLSSITLTEEKNLRRIDCTIT